MPQMRWKFAAMAVLALGLGAATVAVPAQGVEAQEFPTLKKLQAERVALAKKLTPSVVALAESRPDLSNPQATGLAQGTALATSGFVVEEDYVVTNFESAPTNNLEPGKSCWLMAHDGKEFTGKVVGKDKRNLMLLIKMDEGHPKLPSLKLANSDKVEMGATALALGNTHDSLIIDRQISFSFGTVSGFYRFEPIGVIKEDDGGDPYRGNVFEVDCAIHAGDHGGPICNLDGEVIAMMCPHWMAGRHMGCAVPSNQIAAVLPQLKKGVKEDDLAQASLGFKAKYSKEASAIIVTDITANGPADKAGLKNGMHLLRVDNYKIPSMPRLKEMLGIGFIEREVEVGGGFGRSRKTKVAVSYGLPIGTHIQLTVKDPESGNEKTVDLITAQKEDDF